MLSSLINFSTRQEQLSLKNIDSKPVKTMNFYQNMLRFFHWNATLLRRIDAGKSAKKIIAQSKQEVEMAGVRYPVYGQQLEVGALEGYDRLPFYLARISNEYGFHNDHVTMDTVLDEQK